jgi:ubiquinone/menaquinone biosynthesis C-methylase UbiE
VELIQESTSYERIASSYERIRGGEKRALAFANSLLSWIEGAKVVLDVGVGTGIIASLIASAGHEVLGVDLSPGMLRQAAGRIQYRVALADAVSLPIRPNSVDAVIFMWSLHHVGDPIAALREARHALRPDGTVVVVSATPERVVDDIDVLFRRLDVLMRPRESDWIRRSAEGAGLRLIAVDYCESESIRSPLDFVKQIEDRLYSHLWDVDPQRWTDVVEPVMDELRMLEAPERKRTAVLRAPIFVFST